MLASQLSCAFVCRATQKHFATTVYTACPSLYFYQLPYAYLLPLRSNMWHIVDHPVVSMVITVFINNIRLYPTKYVVQLTV